MAETIWKFPLAILDGQFLQLPKGEILTVQVQDGDPYIWIKHDPDEAFIPRFIEIYGTGHEIQPTEPGYERKYIGSFQMIGGAFVGHVFEIVKVLP
jgi:hypothetical protein